jgi:hypothetical protein
MIRKKKAGSNPGKELFENFLTALAKDAAAIDFERLQDGTYDDHERERNAPRQKGSRARANRGPP